MTDSSLSQDDRDESKTIEVRGFSPETSNDCIEYYFDNPRRGGGEIADLRRKNDVIYITFVNAEVAETIVRMTHIIEGHNLEVRLCIPPKPRPTYDDKLLITGIKSTTTKDCLINYLEAKGNCEIDESKVVYGDEEGTVVVHFTKMPDVGRFQKICSEKPLEGNFLTVSRVPVSNIIIVRGLKPKTSEDTTWYYFEGKRSGNVQNVEVEKVQMKSDDGCCLVLQHPGGHKLDGATLNVSIYHEGLGTGGGVYDPTRVKKPDPITVTNLDKYKLALIKEDRFTRTFFEKFFHSEFSWVKGDDITVLLKCIPTKQVSNVQRFFFKWSANVETALKEYLKLLKIEEMDVPRGIWDEVDQILNIGQTDGAGLFDCKDSSQLVVVGFAERSKRLAEKVKTVIKMVEENTVFVQTVSFPKGIQRFLQEYCDEDISEITRNLQQVQISYSKTGEQFTINATKLGMDATMKALENLASKVNHKMFLHKRPGIQKLLKSQKGIEFIKSLERSEKCIIEKYFDSSEKMSVGSKHVMETTAVAGKEVKTVGNCMMPGQRHLFFVQEDITEMNVDVIVCAANEKLDHTDGLAKAIVDRGGKSIQDECRNYIRNYGNVLSGNIAISKPGELSCKMIIHAVGPVWSGGHRNEEETLRKAIFKSLQAADSKNCHSIAIPALSCGIHDYPVHEATAAIVEAIKDHFIDFPTSRLHEIYLIDTSLITVKFFMAAAKQMFGEHNVQMKDGNSFTKPPIRERDFFSSGSKPQKEDNSFEMQLHYFSDYLLSIDASIQAVESYCGEEIIKKVIVDESLQRLKKSQMKKILDLQDQFSGGVMLSEKQDMITIEGLLVDVYNAYEVVQKLLREFDHLEAEQDMATILSNIVQWYYIEVDQQGQTKQVEYDKKVNGIIEKAYRDKQRSVSLEASGQKYIIDFNTMEEYPKNDRNDRVKVVRKDLIKVSAFEAPSHWTPMGEDEDLKVVTLQTSDADYQSVSQEFLNSVQRQTANIIKIERIQNKTLYQQYVVRRRQIIKQSSRPAERKLWIGTSVDAIVSLNTHGFNRSYCGKNAILFGDGVYFAVNASFSAHNTRSRPDSQGYKYMYYASVLTGDFTEGQQGMRVPPVKSPNQALLYDSVVDNVANPGLYIIFNDTQAYPDYLITFTL